MAVINLNNMFPVCEGVYKLADINGEKDLQYKYLLLNELRIIRQKQNLIIENAKKLYTHKVKNGDKSKLAKRCNNFIELQSKCIEYTNFINKNL